MTFSDAVESPVIVDGVTYPKLKIKHFGELAAALQASSLAKAKKALDAEKATPEVRAQVMVRIGSADLSVEHIHDWAWSLDGSRAIVAKSLSLCQPDAGNAARLDAMDVGTMRDIALEVVDHPNSPRRRHKAEVDAEAEKKRIADEAAKLASESNSTEPSPSS